MKKNESNSSIIFIGFFLTFFSGFGQTFFISIFADKILENFEMSYSLWGLIYFFGTILSALSMIFFGSLIDKYAPNKIIFLFFLIYSLSCFMMAFNQLVIILIITIFLLRLCGQGMLSHIAIVLAGKYFQKKRGKALAIVTLGFSLAESLLPIAFVYLMNIFSWKECWFLIGILLLIINFSFTFTIRNKVFKKNQKKDDHVNQKGMRNIFWDRKKMLKNWVFWISLPAFISQPAFTTVFFFQQVIFIKEKNWDLQSYITLLPIYTSFSLVGLFLGGYIIDKFGIKILLPFFLFPLSFGLLICSYSMNLTHVSFALSLLGLMQGLGSVIFGSFWPEFYGTKNLGSIRSLVSSIIIFSTALGPLISGYMMENKIYMESQYFLFSIITILSSFGMISITYFSKKYF